MYNDDQSRRKEYKDGSNNYLSCGIRWGFGAVLLEECLKEYRRQTRGLTLDEQFQRTMADLDRDVRENINTGVVRLRQERKRMEGQKQRNAELRQKYPELYQ